MPTSLSDVLQVVQELWPVENAEAWDAPGLVTGDPSAPVERMLLAVDAVGVTIDEAIATESDLLLVHHPLLLRGVTSIAEDRYKGSLLSRLIRADCALLAAHTNADIVERGTSAVLADALGLIDALPIVPGAAPDTGLGRVGHLAEPTTLGRLARTLADVLPPTASGIRVSGEIDARVQTIALCGGAGDSLLGHPEVTGADVYITADLRHHPASEAREQAVLAGRGPALIDVSHWASEWLWLDAAADQLRSALPELEVTVSDLRTDPWDFVIVQ
ncbi:MULTISPECIES: Nif3-like dinuclear metal center hexameric protein [unclassified Leifsonia]|uniref:Nif3-like dinuclear metal center hexameric protein n=1 Tax=unclassified Leifsonia TaxID=2663824 RepID=UPI0006FD887B|nr:MULTISPECIES: Nif3-like dinuclear metal center hexameric protein [unclassified Leifsonia]KQX07047.1 Nif3-like dinuclear metal center hexameric protein [Leifsonia sp. Root1293]KRA11330.1 Nif3-like dinuclear metal center hexameric protein [Leifsonia sp. Root60]